MRKLFYMGLEPYKARYTLQLTEWNRRVFERRKLNVVYVEGETLDNDQKIVTGQVLDAHGRSYYSMSQMMNLVKMLQRGEANNQDCIYFEDMFQPGFESLPYILDQIPYENRPWIAVRCLAQTVDPDDFVHVWRMNHWMRYYEKLVDSVAECILASNEEMVANMKVAGWTSSIYNVSGLAFGKQEVLERVENIVKPFDQRKRRVAFAARWDQEKQPDFYMDLIEKYHAAYPHSGVEFAVFSGGELKSNNQSYMDRTRKLQADGLLSIYENLDKNEYYQMLNDSRVLFNCALQDWTSNTVSEADTLGCNVLYPAYRSFPEIFANDHERLYVPWSLDDAMNKLLPLLEQPHKNMGKISDYTDGTIDRIVDILNIKNEGWYNRDGPDYRRHLRSEKY